MSEIRIHQSEIDQVVGEVRFPAVTKQVAGTSGICTAIPVVLELLQAIASTNILAKVALAIVIALLTKYQGEHCGK